MTPLQILDSYGLWIAMLILGAVAVALHRLVLRAFGVVMVPQDSVGIVNKKFVTVGKNRSLPDGSVVALNGEAGIQADTLAPGVHFWLWPWQFEVRLEKFVTIGQGQVGVVESRDGSPIKPGRVLGKSVACDSFQSARLFLTNGGERGPQMAIVPPGTYRINTALFTVDRADAFDIAADQVGIVTTMDGRPLPSGEIAGNEVADHDSFQDGQKFIDGGGSKGLQTPVMLGGRYYLNPLFVRVKTIGMTEIPIAHVGVVISFVGRLGADVTGETFKHGNLCHRGEKGVWIEPLDPGKYPINLLTQKVEIVPTANVVLNWANEKSEAHKLDENLSTITVRSSDGFTFNLDVSQIIHIPRTDAPKVIARFGSMPNLVTQVLEPTIGNYFRNAAQGSDVIEFLKSRQERQADARTKIEAALAAYNVGAVDTLIGDIVPPEALMKTLTDRKIAAQQKVTFENQKEAETERQKLQQARALAETQPEVVAAERKVQIAEFNAQSQVKAAEGQKAADVLAAEGEARAKVLQGEADAAVTRATGFADAEKIEKVGAAEASVVKLKIESMQAGNYAGIEIAKALAQSRMPLVPEVVAGGSGDGSSAGPMMALLLANILRGAAVSANGAVADKSLEIAR